jgi:outer membrane biogenesis lipoprotein LolB
LRRAVRVGVEPLAKTEVIVSGQLALIVEKEGVAPAVVWETLPSERQLQLAARLARLLARLVEGARDE